MGKIGIISIFAVIMFASCISVWNNTGKDADVLISAYSTPAFIDENRILLAPKINRFNYLMTIDAETYDIEKIFSKGKYENCYEPNYSPNTTDIVFSIYNNESSTIELYITDIVQEEHRRLTFADQYSTAPVFSIDSTKIYFTRAKPKHFDFQIYSVNVSGEDEQQLSNESSNIISPLIRSIDGSSIFFMEGELSNSHNRKICRFDINSKAISVIAAFGMEMVSAISVDNKNNLYYSIWLEDDNKEPVSNEIYSITEPVSSEIYSLEMDGKKNLFLKDLPCIDYFSFSPDDSAMLIVHPLGYFYKYDIEKKELKKIKIQYDPKKWKDVVYSF